MKTYIRTNVHFPIPGVLSMKTYIQINVDFPIPWMPCKCKKLQASKKKKKKKMIFTSFRNAKHENVYMQNNDFPFQRC